MIFFDVFTNEIKMRKKYLSGGIYEKKNNILLMGDFAH